MAKRPYPQTTFYHLLAAYADAINRTGAALQQSDMFLLKLPPQTIGRA